MNKKENDNSNNRGNKNPNQQKQKKLYKVVNGIDEIEIDLLYQNMPGN